MTEHQPGMVSALIALWTSPEDMEIARKLAHYPLSCISDSQSLLSEMKLKTHRRIDRVLTFGKRRQKMKGRKKPITDRKERILSKFKSIQKRETRIQDVLMAAWTIGVGEQIHSRVDPVPPSTIFSLVSRLVKEEEKRERLSALREELKEFEVNFRDLQEHIATLTTDEDRAWSQTAMTNWINHKQKLIKKIESLAEGT